MTIKTLIIAALSIAAAAASTTAFASSAEGRYEFQEAFTSTLTRAEVRQAAIEALAAGTLTHGDRTIVAEPVGMAKTRAQVRAETLEAVRLGLVGGGEQTVVPTAAQLDSIRMAGERAVAMTLASR